MAYNGESWQSDNFTQELRDQGLTSGGAITGMYDFNGSVGGPMHAEQDLVPLRRLASTAVDNLIPPAFRDHRRPVHQAGDGAHHLAGHAQEQDLDSPRSHVQVARPPFRAAARCSSTESASRIHDNPLYYWGVVKWTSTAQLPSARRSGPDPLRSAEHHEVPAWRPPGAVHARVVCRRVEVRSRSRARSGPRRRTSTRSTPERYSWQGSASYVTGSHHFKIGRQLGLGAPADLLRIACRPAAGIPHRRSRDGPDSQLADQLRRRQDDRGRGGLRAGLVDAQAADGHRRAALRVFRRDDPRADSPAGRFVGERHFEPDRAHPAVQQSSCRGWRLSTICSATAKTAIKSQLQQVRRSADAEPDDAVQSVGRGHRSRPVARSQQRRCRAGRVGLRLSHRRAARSSFPRCRRTSATRALNIQDPDLKRPTNTETSVAIQHELRPRVLRRGGLVSAHLPEPALRPISSIEARPTTRR